MESKVRIVNKTGKAWDTKILIDGQDMTRALLVREIHITAEDQAMTAQLCIIRPILDLICAVTPSREEAIFRLTEDQIEGSFTLHKNLIEGLVKRVSALECAGPPGGGAGL